MGLALVCISTVEPQLYRPYGTGTSFIRSKEAMLYCIALHIGNEYY